MPISVHADPGKPVVLVKPPAEAVEDAYNEAQATLEDATGSTASVTELTATTKAARNRVRSFQRQLFA